MKVRQPAMNTILSALATSAFATAASAGSFDSAYTTQNYQKCPIALNEPGAITRHCTGYGGVRINWFGADDDAIVDFGRKGNTVEAEGLSFAAAKDTIEWRGPLRGKTIAPLAAIVRYSICQTISGPCHDELYVYRLNGRESSCVMAVVDGRPADANVQARRIADDFGAVFRCGRDKVKR